MQGTFPMSWEAAANTLKVLTLDKNAALTGCVPLQRDAYVSNISTGITGLCPVDVSVEQSQRRTVQDLLPKLLFGVGPASNVVTQGYHTMVEAAVKWSSQLGSLTEGSKATLSTITHPADVLYGEIIMMAAAVNWPTDGTEYITMILFNAASTNTTFPTCAGHHNPIGMGINVQYLTYLLKQLPYMQYFSCTQCFGNPNSTELVLPADLPEAAPNLQFLDLQSVGIGGTLPQEWGSWTSIKDIFLDHNCIQGPLPASYAGMTNLTYLTVANNQITGTLPAAWGERKLMSQSLRIDLRGTRIYSTIPPSWSHFKLGYVKVNSAPSQLYGCIPAGTSLVAYDDCKPGTCPKFPVCSSLSAEAVALHRLKTMLHYNVTSNGQPSPLDTWVDTTGRSCTQLLSVLVAGLQML
jgi:hypothetical protein